jgi:hypothetical protein
MSDAALQALLDPDASGRGIQILRSYNADTTTTSYYCQLGATANGNPGGMAKWVDVTTANTDAAKNTAIRAAFNNP